MPTSPTATTRRGLPGRKVLLVCASLVVLLAGTAGWWMVRERPKAGPYIDVLALEGDFVVGIRSELTRGRAFVELVDAEQGLRWQALIPSYRVADGAIGVAASEHAISVRFARDGRTQIFGFATSTSKKLGTLILGDELAKEPDGHASPDAATISAGADAFEILQPDRGPVRVYDVSLRNGKAQWHVDLPEAGVQAAWVDDGHLVIEQPTSVSVIPRDGSTVWSTPSDHACLVDAGLVVGSGEKIELIALDGEHARVALPSARFTGLCGQYGQRLLLGIGIGEGWSILTVAVADPAVVIAGKQGAGTLATEATMRLRINAPDAIPLAGSLPAVVPVLIESDAGGRVIGIDVQGGAGGWESATTPSLSGATLIDAGDVALLRTGDLLFSIDPATGVARAVRAPDTRPLWPHHAAGGGVWLIGDRGILELDARTLEQRGRWGKLPPTVTPDAAAVSAIGLRTSP